MFEYIDVTFPWIANMLELGGDVLLLILAIAFLMWGLILERLVYLHFEYPKHSSHAFHVWRARDDHRSWCAQQFRNRLLLHLRWNLQRNVSLINIFIKLCPLLGLLGTVVGMLEVFDAMAATGNNSPKSTASGVSKSTVSTMAGMVVAISGLLISVLLERKIKYEEELASKTLTFDETFDATKAG